MANIFSLYGSIFIDNKKANESIDTTNKKAKLSKENFTEVSNKCGELSKKMAVGFAAGVAAITGLVEGTKDYRNAVNGLDTAFQNNNLSSELARDTYKELYGVLGDTDKAKESAQFLALMADNEKELAEWTNACTGIYSQFGDALPIESLTEAANETAKVGKVTGSLADALNWIGISEEEFNAKLQACNSESERENLIRSTLNEAYSNSADLYRENNESLIQNNESQVTLTESTARLAEVFEPLIAKGKEVLANVLVKITPVMQFIIDNINIIGPLILSVWLTITGLGMVNKIKNLGLTLKTFFTFISANPIVLIVGAIIAVILLLIFNWDKCKAAIKVGVDFIVNGFISLKNKTSEIFNGIKSVILNIMNGIVSAVKFPINLIIGGLNTFIRGINKVKIPNWVPGVGGKGINIPLIPRLRKGLNYVPYDDMPALLHKGERVLTAREAKAYKEENGAKKVVNNVVINITTSKIDEKEADRIVELVNLKLGEAY